MRNRIWSLIKKAPKISLSCLKRSLHLTKKVLKVVHRCLNYLWNLVKKISRLVYACMKGFAMLVTCCILIITLVLALDMLPGPGVSSHQIAEGLPPLAPSMIYDHTRSTVRLFNKHGDFFCSGVVVGSNYVLTAGHCLVDGSGRMGNGEIIVVNDDGKTVVKARPAGVNLRMDWGLILGDFSDIPGAKVEEVGWMPRREVLACGYPQGAKALTCQTLVPMMNDAFLIKCNVGGMLFPGMSGGPVFDEQGTVVGLNSQVYEARDGGGVAYAPVTGIFANFLIADY